MQVEICLEKKVAYACPWVSEERGKLPSCKLQILQERTWKINLIPSPTPCLMSQGSWQNMAYSLPMVPLNMAGQWADREGPLRCLIRLLHCSISHFKRQPTLSNIYHRTDPILELIYPICSGQSPQNQMMLGMTKSTPQKAASVWQERTQGVSRGPLSKSEQLCLPHAAWGHAARQLCSQRSRSYSLHIWRGCGTSSSPMEQAEARRASSSLFL